ncbi:transcription factor LAF1-like [Zingiber officinale]|uniref:transcription factor LAF1-like n=1 Tax=Zingiber officinale TaxID=94328 RepID=UPI001C4AEC1B|nr:transcription factor LAF1-like [Zingiber officinale]
MRMECRNLEKPQMENRKGLWSPDEDQKVKDHILKHGVSCWNAVPAKAGLQRNGKSCSLRWLNYLRPGLKRGNFSPEEEETIVKLQAKIGNKKWSQIAMHLPGRTDNEMKNHWNSYLKKKIMRERRSNCSMINIEPLGPCLKDHEPSVAHCIDSGGCSLTGRRAPKIQFAEWLSFDGANLNSLFNLEDAVSNQ